VRILNKIDSAKRRIHGMRKLNSLNSLKSQEKIILLGNQKSGTTAIAALLAQATGESVTLDFKSAIYDMEWQLVNRMKVADFSDFVFQYRKEFRSRIIKEPSLTLFYDDLHDIFPNWKFSFIIRNPFQNIRSILNRLQIPGDLDQIEFDDWPELNNYPAWRLVLNSTWLGKPGYNYIESLAFRWCEMAQIYLDNSDNITLFKYEKFVNDKENEIYELAQNMGLNVFHDIGKIVNTQYQSRGNANLSIDEFFGAPNLRRIENICKDYANKFGYALNG
jgi:hypothetical protein